MVPTDPKRAVGVGALSSSSQISWKSIICYAHQRHPDFVFVREEWLVLWVCLSAERWV
jgi:hypothetical protein